MLLCLFYVTDHTIAGILTEQQNKGSRNETILHGSRAVAGKDGAGPSFLSVSHRIPVLHVLQAGTQQELYTLLQGLQLHLAPIPQEWDS